MEAKELNRLALDSAEQTLALYDATVSQLVIAIDSSKEKLAEYSLAREKLSRAIEAARKAQGFPVTVQ